MERLTLVEAQQHLHQLADTLTDEPVIITRDGQPVMAAMSYEQLVSLLETLDILADTEFASLLQQSMSHANQADTISWDDAKVQLEV